MKLIRPELTIPHGENTQRQDVKLTKKHEASKYFNIKQR